MTTALVDGDLIAYRCAAASENEAEHVATSRANDLLQRILQETSSETYLVFLSGSNNYRYQYNREYKANRKDIPKPKWLQAVREHLVVEHKASVEEEQEADDALGIYQCNNEDTILCSLDKDLLMIPGKHFQWSIAGTTAKGERWEKPSIFYDQSDIVALRHFYWQLIMGDRADNVFGFDGRARQTVPKKLEATLAELDFHDNELDLFNYVRSLYDDDDRLLMNGICLWIRRNEGEIWEFPK